MSSRRRPKKMKAAASSIYGILRLRQIPVGVRYVAVGATCAILNNILLIAAVAAGLGYLSGIFIICLPMLIIGFALHTSVTFETPPTIKAFLRYSTAILASYPIWITSLFLLCDIAHLPIVFAGPIATVILFAWNYVSTHWAILRSARFIADWRRPPNGADSS
jgi:putative flippase GtrA